jgi:hypothetical protein
MDASINFVMIAFLSGVQMPKIFVLYANKSLI